MDIRPNASGFSPIGEPSSNNTIDDYIDYIDKSKRYIQMSGEHSNSSETKALENRSLIETKTITSVDLVNLIKEQKFSNDVHYQVEGNLNLKGFTGLTALPEHLSVGGDLDLSGCTGLTALPEHLSVGGSLYLSGCTGLTALPEQLSVGGGLYLSSCTGLTALPEHLSVGGGLDLFGCTGLTALPEHLSVGGTLDLSRCTGLTALPNWITTLGATTRGTTRNVFLYNTGLSDTLIDHLRGIRALGMQFSFSSNLLLRTSSKHDI